MKNSVITIAFIFSGFIARAQMKIGDMSPDINLPNAKDSVVSLSSFHGKVVLLDFWASWCSPCRALNPGLGKLYSKYKQKGFEIFAISIDNKKSAWLKAILQDKIKYTQVNDKAGWNSLIAEKYHVEEMPSSFLLDKEGRIVAIDLEGIDLENKIKALL